MITFIIDRDYSIDDNKRYVFAEISVDSVDELPATNEAVDGKYLVAGSIALVIATGNFYVLNSLGEWIKQTGEDEGSNTSNSSGTNSANSANSTLNLSPTTNIDRSALLNKSNVIKSNEEIAETADEPSKLEDVLATESVIEPETAEKDGEADVLGDTESE